MNEDKLNSLALLNIVAELLNDKINVDNVIEEFSMIKARRKPM